MTNGVVSFVQNIVADMRKLLAKNPHLEHKKLHRRVFMVEINPKNPGLVVSLNFTTFIFFWADGTNDFVILAHYFLQIGIIIDNFGG